MFWRGVCPWNFDGADPAEGGGQRVAVGAAPALDGDALAAALGGIGTVDDSPRGPWNFDGQTPRQNIYLRRVANVGGTLVNAVVTDLGPQSQPV